MSLHQISWFLLHIVGPITFATVVVGVLAKVFKSLFPQGYDEITHRLGASVGRVVGGVWFFFFLRDEEKERLDTFDTTGVDPALAKDTDTSVSASAAAEEPVEPTDIPDALLDQFATMYEPTNA